MYAITMGSPANRILRYAMETGCISSGVFSKDMAVPARASLAKVRHMAQSEASRMEFAMTWRSFPCSPAPNFCAINMENPWANPCVTPRVSQFSQSTAPRAARASTPRTFPTTAVSTTVYICWKIFPAISGRENRISILQGFPSVWTFVFCSIAFLCPTPAFSARANPTLPVFYPAASVPSLPDPRFFPQKAPHSPAR